MKKFIVETINNNLTKEELQELMPNDVIYELEQYIEKTGSDKK